ncbi:MAG: S1/P1 nuclease [Deltaproteobacteria bacterium]|nr:S1/P1 nuclease [Deltaproteobacteria bacterium]
MLFAVLPEISFGWGPEGHEIVARIAQFYLTDNAKQQVSGILHGSTDLAAIANWADQVRPQRPDTAKWHFIDIPRTADSIDPARDCDSANCVTEQAKRFAAILSGSASGDKEEALKFLVHFMGDMHQPLHCANDNDRGGNDVHVNFLGDGHTNLHKVWDSGLLGQMDDQDQLTADLITAITPANKLAWSQGAPDDWALESHDKAVSVAYKNVPKRAGRRLPTLDESYEAAADPVVTEQLQKAGFRLAMVLNQAIGQ